MKSIVIAQKDLKQSFRSAFALAFMFAVPLLVTGMFYLMFGSQSTQPEVAFQPPVTRVVVVNLDQGDENLALGISASAPAHEIASLGDALVSSLQAPSLSGVMVVDEVNSEAEARQRVDEKSAGVALIIPADFSANYAGGKETALVELYHDPSEAIGPGIVKSVVGQMLDSFSGVRIAVEIAASNLPQGSDLVGVSAAAAQQYAAFTAAAHDPSTLVELHPLDRAEDSSETSSQLANIISPIMGGMMIFFAFFTGGSTAQSILKEDEQGTLSRLFTTATRYSTILTGKFLAVGLTVLVQVIVLLAASNLIFHIQWGTLAAVALAAAGIIACAAAFGIFLTSLIKSTRQGGAVYGGFLTVTGMLGMLPIFTGGGGGAMDMVSLITPQGWAVRGLTLAMNGANLPDIAVNTMVLIVLSGVFMAIGVWKFQRRFA